MSFGGSQPAPMMVPPAPTPAPMMTPTTAKPAKKNQQPSFIGAALSPQAGQTGAVSIGGAKV